MKVPCKINGFQYNFCFFFTRLTGRKIELWRLREREGLRKRRREGLGETERESSLILFHLTKTLTKKQLRIVCKVGRVIQVSHS